MKKSYIFSALLMGLTAFGTVSCGHDYEKADFDKPLSNVTLPTVVTGTVQEFGVAAKADITVTAPEGVEVDEAGFILSSTPDAILADASNRIIQVNNLVNGETKTVNITDLTAGETYYIKAFAYVDGGIAYGDTKTIVASNDYVSVPYYEVNFSDMTAADADDFTVASFGEYTNPFEPVSLAIVGLRMWAFSGSVLDPSLFSTGQAALASTDVKNVLTYKADFTGKGFPSVTVGGINTAALFGSSYNTQPGDFSVLVSKTPITTEEELEAATVIGTCKFSTDIYDDTFEESGVTASIPEDYDGECYISIYSHSVWGSNLGVLITEFSLASLQKQSAE